jgi:hypothetical protein
MKANRIWIALNFLIVAALACNMPGGAAEPTETPTPGLPPTETSTPAPAETATATLTPSPSVPVVSVTTATNCRTGPYTSFDIIITLNPGLKAELIGKNSGLNYWIIKVPGGSGQCWLWGQYAVVEGNASGLPEYPSPPTPTPSAPLAVKNFKADVTCDLVSSGTDFIFLYNDVHVELTWTDVATNEEGYKIFRDDELVATLSANTTGVEDDTTLAAIYIIDDGPPFVTYSIRAFNSAGQSDKKDVQVDCVE